MPHASLKAPNGQRPPTPSRYEKLSHVAAHRCAIRSRHSRVGSDRGSVQPRQPSSSAHTSSPNWSPPGEQATSLALDALNDLADDARQRISDATAYQADLRDSLHDLAGKLRSHIESGERLLPD